jgi:predicted acyltransferase
VFPILDGCRYVLVSGGAAGLALSLCFAVVDVRQIGKRVWQPFMYTGMNAITM